MLSKEYMQKILQGNFHSILTSIENSSERELETLHQLNKETESIGILLEEINVLLVDEKNLSIDQDSHRGLKPNRTVANFNVLNKNASVGNSNKNATKGDKLSNLERNNKSVIEEKSKNNLY
jgi:hypothetical protein